jgi:hypothetical protein
LLDLLLAEIKRNITSAGYMANVQDILARIPTIALGKSQEHESRTFPKVNRFNVKDYFDKLRELRMRSEITANLERIYNADEKGCNLFVAFRLKT